MTKGANFRRRQSAVDLIFAPPEAKEKENEKEEEDREEDYGKFIGKSINFTHNLVGKRDLYGSNGG